MRVHVKVLGHDLAPSLRTLIEQHFRFAASPFKSAVQAVHVTLSDVVGGGSSAGKRCQAELELRNGGRLRIANEDVRAESAVQRVAERIAPALQDRGVRRRAKSLESCAA